MNKSAVIVGGFTAGRRILQPVGNAVCDRFGFNRVEIIMFINAIDDPAKLNHVLKGRTVFVHSSGLLAVAQCKGMKRVVAFNAPEPISIDRLISKAVLKVFYLCKTIVTGPHRMGAARVIASNIFQTIAHPLAYARQLAALSRFSATKQLEHMRTSGVLTTRIDTSGDEYYRQIVLQSRDGQRLVLPGCHDQVLISPVEFIAQIPYEALVA